MKRVWRETAKILTGLFVGAMCAMPQATISARPGVVNYIEGHAYIDGHELSASKLRNVALYANQTLSTDVGKAEVLLTPGVFLRIGDNSAVRMISPSLTDTQFEVVKGEAMVEAAQVVKDNNIEVISHGAVIRIEKDGLYRINADMPPTVSVFEGEAQVQIGTSSQQVKKDRELILAAGSKPQKFNKKTPDELYAWSNVRSEYEAGASYASARTAAASFSGGSGFGYASGFGPGWYYNSPWNSWAWLPGNGYAFSPFGYGFFSPGYVGYAPVIVGGGGGGYYVGRHHGNGNYTPGEHDHDGHGNWHGHSGALVPVNPNSPPAQGMAFRSPAALSAARSAAFRSGIGSRAMMASPRSGAMSGGGFHFSGNRSGGGSFHGGASAGGGHFSGGGGHFVRRRWSGGTRWRGRWRRPSLIRLGKKAARSSPGAAFLLITLLRGREAGGKIKRFMHYLLKTEPDDYSFSDLQRDGATVWTGVTNPTAVKHLREMKHGDKLLIYHTGGEKQAVGSATVTAVNAEDPKVPLVTIKAGAPLGRPKTLSEVKQTSLFADSPLVKQGRLSVVPLSGAQYEWFLKS